MVKVGKASLFDVQELTQVKIIKVSSKIRRMRNEDNVTIILKTPKLVMMLNISYN